MADTKTTAEAAASALGGTELVRGVQSAANVKITIDQIKTYISGALGAAVGTSLALGGATLGAHNLAVTGSVDVSSSINAGNKVVAVDAIVAGGSLTGANGKIGLYYGVNLSLASDIPIEWSSTTAQSGAKDASLARAGAGHITSESSFSILNATAIPAAGTAAAGYKFSSTANFGVFFGSGAPTLSAAKGSLYLRSDGSGIADRAYINTNGTTAWTAIATAS